MTRLTRKPVVALLAVAAAALAALAASRTWAQGTAEDAVLGGASVQGTGGDLAPGLVALALVVAAGGVAAISLGRIGRWVALVAVVGAAVGMIVLTAGVLADPGAALGRIAAASSGRSGGVSVRAAASAWPWVAVGSGVLGLLAGLLGVSGARRWAGPSARYERPDAAGAGRDTGSAGARGERSSSTWDRLTAGEDPTEG